MVPSSLILIVTINPDLKKNGVSKEVVQEIVGLENTEHELFIQI